MRFHLNQNRTLALAPTLPPPQLVIAIILVILVGSMYPKNMRLACRVLASIWKGVLARGGKPFAAVLATQEDLSLLLQRVVCSVRS